MKLPGGTMSGGNAMCFIGYQDDSSSPGGGFFILRNSWGTGWGSACPYGAGNGTVPYQYIANDGWEAVTTPVPRRRLIWDDWRWRRFDPRPFDPRPFDPRPFGEGEGNDGPSPRRTIMLEDGDADIIIR